MNKEFELILPKESSMKKMDNLNSLAIPPAKEKISGSGIETQIIEPIGVAFENPIEAPFLDKNLESEWQKEIETIFNNLNLVINEARDIALMGIDKVYQGMFNELKEREAANKAKEQLNIQSQQMIKDNAAQVGLNPSSLETQPFISPNAPTFQIPPKNPTDQNWTM